MASSRFYLWSTLPGSKITRYEHLQSIYQQTGQKPDELDVPELPEVISHVWEWFLELHSGRQGGPISFTEIKAWSELCGTNIRPWEVRAIKEIDIEYLKSQSNG